MTCAGSVLYIVKLWAYLRFNIPHTLKMVPTKTTPLQQLLYDFLSLNTILNKGYELLKLKCLKGAFKLRFLRKKTFDLFSLQRVQITVNFTVYKNICYCTFVWQRCRQHSRHKALHTSTQVFYFGKWSSLTTLKKGVFKFQKVVPHNKLWIFN